MSPNSEEVGEEAIEVVGEFAEKIDGHETADERGNYCHWRRGGDVEQPRWL